MKPKDFAAVTARLQEALDEKSWDGATDAAQSHLRSVQLQIEAISKGDFETVLAQAAPDVTLDIFAPPEFAWIRQARGIAELRNAMQQNFASVEDQQPEISNIFAEGDVVVLFGHERGRIRGSEQSYHMEFAQRFTFRSDRLVSVRIIAAYVP